jgi:hypothetical protein
LVVPGHFYVAQVDGYDRSDLMPLLAGSSILVDPSTSEPVTPRWTAKCGTSCPYEDKVGCPARPLGAEPDDKNPYDYAVRAESELTQEMNPCWDWSNL